MLPPVQQCNRGHVICNGCLQQLPTPKQCPSCRVSLADPARNLRLETAVASLEVACKYANAGCTQRMLYSDVMDHSRSCAFRPCACVEDCGWIGSLDDQVKSHLVKVHGYNDYTECPLVACPCMHSERSHWHEYKNKWMHGCMGAWMHGYIHEYIRSHWHEKAWWSFKCADYSTSLREENLGVWDIYSRCCGNQSVTSD